MMYGYRKSDSSIVPEKSPNKFCFIQDTEVMEERGLAKGSPFKQNMPRTQSRTSVPSAFERIRQSVNKDKKQQLTALFHHVYAIDHLRTSYYALKRKAAAGVDGVTWQQYGENLEANLRGLAARLENGAYRAKPVRRAYIPKPDGRQRPIGITAFEDKLVQRAVAGVLNVVYEQDFLNFSYGFRPGRSQHQALDALTAGIMTRKVGWVLDADLRAFFDTLSHEWLVKFVEHRIADQRIVRLIQKWLKAGVLEDGKRIRKKEGTAQGGSISPLLSNIYLHYVLDLWVQWWRNHCAHGDVIIARYADDFVLGFQYRNEAERFLVELQQRLARFGLELHPDKTRLLEFGRFAISSREGRGDGKPDTFNFLGFTHICGKTRKGKFAVVRRTIRKKWHAKLKEVYAALRLRMHDTIPEQGAYLRAVVGGHIRYYGVPLNSRAISSFRHAVRKLWLKVLRRRSQRNRVTWERVGRLARQWFPPARICHPHPLDRFGVIT